MNLSKRSNFFIILILGALSSVTPFAIDMYLPAFPQIAAEFRDDRAENRFFVIELLNRNE